jgi:zinc protease
MYRHCLGLARWLLLVCTFIGCGPIHPGRTFQDRFPDPESGQLVLPNGVRVFLERDPQSPVVSIGWMVPAGTANDPPGKEGLAHLTEHLVFRAPREGGTSALDFFGQSGIKFQGETSRDATEFTIGVHRERFGELLSYELARMANPLSSLDSAQLAQEVRILHEEEAAQRPPWRTEAISSLLESLFPGGSAFIRKPESETRSLDQLTIEDARQFVAAHYQPSAMRLFVLGDFSWEEVEARWGKVTYVTSSAAHEAALKLASPVSPRVGKAPDKAISRRGYVAENVLLIGWPLPPHVDMLGIEPLLVPLVNSVIPRIEGPSHGRYPAGMVQGAQGDKNVEIITTRQGSVLLVNVQLPPDTSPGKMASSIIIEVNTLADKISENPAAFTAIQKGVHQARLMETDFLDVRTSRLMNQHALGDFRLSKEYFSDLIRVSAQQAEDFSRAWLKRSSARVVVVSPMATKGAAPAPLTIREPRHANLSLTTPIVSMGKEPKALFPGGRFVWKKLPNDMEVAVLSRPRSTVNTMLLGVRATVRNPSLEPIHPIVEVARATLRCPKSAMMCAHEVDGSSMRAMVSSLREDAMFSVQHLFNSAHTYRYEWSQPVKETIKPLFEKREAMPEATARREFLAALWGDHPRGKRLSSDLLQRTTYADLLLWEYSNIRPENAVVIAVTNDDPNRVANLISRDMEHWTVGKQPAQMPEIPLPNLTQVHPVRVLYATDPGLEAARFSFGCLMPPLQTFSQRAAAKMLGDWVYRVLFQMLRTQADSSYSTSMNVRAYSSGETFMQGLLDVNAEQVGEAIALFRSLYNAPHIFDERQLVQMKELRIRQVALNDLSGPDVVTEIFDRWSFHMGNPSPLRGFDEIRQVTRQQVQGIWDACRGNAVLQVRTKQPVKVIADDPP